MRHVFLHVVAIWFGDISIHAPYKRVRLDSYGLDEDTLNISIHAPYKRVRRIWRALSNQFFRFQSTHPTRECDSLNNAKSWWKPLYFNPRTLQESATLSTLSIVDDPKFQSTHPTRECDSQKGQNLSMKKEFQSTHPTRECDNMSGADKYATAVISIHAPYKRVRQCKFFILTIPPKFQSTHPTRECDVKGKYQKDYSRYFNPRTLQESATGADRYHRASQWSFQSTHPTRECDPRCSTRMLSTKISIHAPYKRVRPQYIVKK